MKVIKFENREDWFEARRGKITGSRLKDVISRSPYTKEDIVKELEVRKIEFDGKLKKDDLDKLLPEDAKAVLQMSGPKKMGFYEIIAERLALPPDEEDVMERGNRLEEEALALFQKETGKEVNPELVMWQSDENDSIAISPDGTIGETEAVEVKCLSSAKHIAAWHSQEIQSEYREQAVQYFIVNDKLQTLYFAFYDPRFPALPFHTIEIKREDIEDKIEAYRAYQKRLLAEIDELIIQLTF